MQRAKMALLCGAMIFLLIAPLANAQTIVEPEQDQQDPRLLALKRVLKEDHASVRPVTTYVRVDTRRKNDENDFLALLLQDLLIDVGAEPVSSRRNAQFQLTLVSQATEDQSSGAITEVLTLRFSDIQASGGQLIWSSATTLRCQRRPYGTFARPAPSCIIDQSVLREAFLRLR